MAEGHSRTRRFWVVLATIAALAIFVILAGRLVSGEEFWIILNGILQHELG